MAQQQQDKHELNKEIVALINTIKQQADLIGLHPKQADLDLMLQKIEQLHKKTIVLNYLNTIPEPEIQKNAVPEMNIPVRSQIVELPQNEKSEITNPSSIENKTEQALPTQQVDVPSQPINPSPEAKIPAPIQSETPKAEIPLTNPVEVPKTELPLSTQEPTLAKNKISSSALPTANGRDIRTMIGFNEKLMFLRNLFSGNAAAYDEALNQLNTSSSVEEAESLLTRLRYEHRWSADNEATEQFLLLVKRRFS